MLYLDGISFNKIKDELLISLKGKSVSKIVQTSTLAISMSFGKQTLIFSCFPSLPLCYLSNIKEDNNLENTSTFSLNLKKLITGSTLTSIKQDGYDRVLIFTFSKLNELSEIKSYSLYFEIMGKHSNLILVDKDNKVIDSIKRFSLEESSSRVLFPGAIYSPATAEKKISPILIDEDKFDLLKESNSLLSTVEGMGKFLANYLTDFKEFQRVLNSTITPKIFFNEHKEIILATVLDISPKEFITVENFSSFEEFINIYIGSENLSNTFKLLKDRLLLSIKKEKKKAEKILSSIKKDLLEKQNFDRFREEGDILASSLHTVKKGMDKVELYDFYNDSMCTIALDPLLSPKTNLEKLYKRYNKLKKGIEHNNKRFEEFSETLKYLTSIETFIENSDSKENLKMIEEELISQGYLKNSIKQQNRKIKKQQPKSLSFGEINIDGIDVIYGRNNLENDALISKYANREDLWFHCKDVPGTHVIVSHSISLTDEQIYSIALFCAKMSKLQPSTKVSVDYTKVKYLNKPKGARPGFVTYKIFESIIVKV